MGDYENRGRGGRGYNNRKRRYRGELRKETGGPISGLISQDDDDYDRRPQRRRYEEPPVVKIRKQLLSIAESLKKPEDEIRSISQALIENYDDEELRNNVLDLILQLTVEQPFKIPFVAAVILVSNPQKPEIAKEALVRAASDARKYLEDGSWRQFKLSLRFLGCLQGLFEGDGVFTVLEELFSRAIDLQTASSDDGLGLELVKIILLTIPYILSSSALGFEQQAASLLEKTDIIASTPHALEALVDPYPEAERPREPVLSLLQKQLQTEAGRDWELACIPRVWKLPLGEDGQDPLATATKHAFPEIPIPKSVNPGPKSLFPEVFFSAYADQEVETVPPSTEIASSLLRDALIDTINILDFNRNATARFLIDIDCYFSTDTFIKRATPFDRLKEVAGDKSTWKPEDVAVDAVFSQLFQLPTPEHKLVYYHSVLTEACKIAPAAIAPSLGRAIRFLYRNLDSMDMELSFRFMDWFSHHLSNFGFTWKWTEWSDDVELPDIHPKKAFIIGALEKEIRLSFAQRIRGTLPEPYQPLIAEAKEKDAPDFKYSFDETPFALEGKEIISLLRKKAPEVEIQGVLNLIQEKAMGVGIADPLIPSTDAYVTSICAIGSKSLSHVLSCIERCKERLLAIGPQSETARRQIISSAMDYWKDQPGVGVNIIDKLLNYTILTPMSVIEWALIDHNDQGRNLAKSHIYEMVSTTVFKVTNRVRQIVAARDQEGLPDDQVNMLNETLVREREEQKIMFKVIEDSLINCAHGTKDEIMENSNSVSVDERLLRKWPERWLKVFRRKFAVEEAVIGDAVRVQVKAED
ncbi:hypothetical protein FGG08_002305 [Glutinoglossum americanum]|uniref:Nuclear cap-binding protein subunit 1 n=1 Tax=Glutinoglossum americanum TaxID=1670608 RepID=A0A9P8I9F7_9PEZI|nr:hypothetical protein FGG08_002305 [Glutinoglossum americanum]